MDIEVRQVVFWGTFAFDRLWAVYLGRPPTIKLDDVSISRPSRNASCWDLEMFSAWVGVLEIAGEICDKLNAGSCDRTQVMHFTQRLDQWKEELTTSLQYAPGAVPSIYNLHIQWSAVMILLHRPHAGFGTASDVGSPGTVKNSRSICVENAIQITQILKDYKAHHFQAYTLMGSALYNISVAATTLVADIASQKNEDVSVQYACLGTCIRTMKEMESSEMVARNVRKLVQSIMKACNVNDRSTNSAGSDGSITRVKPIQPLLEPNVQVPNYGYVQPEQYNSIDLDGADPTFLAAENNLFSFDLSQVIQTNQQSQNAFTFDPIWNAAEYEYLNPLPEHG